MSDDVHRADGRRIDTSIRIDASPARIWQAWTDPADLSRWFTDDARGEVVKGGTITWVFHTFGVEIPYPVVVAEPDRRMVLAGETTERGPFALEVILEEQDDGTVVRLVNSGFLDGAEWDEEYRGVASGWELALALLRHYVENHAGRPRRSVVAFRPAGFQYDALANDLYRTGAGLRRWLTAEGNIGETGDAVDLVLSDGRPLTGRVLARTGTEVAVSWTEEDAVLELKAFRGGPHRMLGVRLTAWGAADERMETHEASLQTAVERLVEVATVA